MKEVAPDLVGGQVTLEAAGAGGRERQGGAGQVGSDGADRDGRAGCRWRGHQQVCVVALDPRFDLQRGVARLRQARVDDVAEESIRRRPMQQVRRPSTLRVAGPRQHPPQPVLPGREQGIALWAFQHDVRGGPRRRRHITRQSGETVERHARDHLRERCELRRDATLDDPGLEGLTRFFQEDLGDVLQAVALIGAAVSPARHRLHH